MKKKKQPSRSALWQRANHLRGLCWCGRPRVKGRRQCERCPEKYRKWYRANRAKGAA